MPIDHSMTPCCPECHSETFDWDEEAGTYECQDCGEQFDQPYTACDNPGRNGCGSCDACEDWGADEADAIKEDV